MNNTPIPARLSVSEFLNDFTHQENNSGTVAYHGDYKISVIEQGGLFNQFSVTIEHADGRQRTFQISEAWSGDPNVLVYETGLLGHLKHRVTEQAQDHDHIIKHFRATEPHQMSYRDDLRKHGQRNAILNMKIRLTECKHLKRYFSSVNGPPHYQEHIRNAQKHLSHLEADLKTFLVMHDQLTDGINPSHDDSLIGTYLDAHGHLTTPNFLKYIKDHKPWMTFDHFTKELESYIHIVYDENDWNEITTLYKNIFDHYQDMYWECHRLLIKREGTT